MKATVRLKSFYSAFLTPGKGRRVELLCVLVFSVLTVASCRESESTFVSNCVANDHSNLYCSCVYDIANDALNDDQFELYSATVAGDRQRAAKVSASFGPVDAGLAATRIAWVEMYVESGCRGDLQPLDRLPSDRAGEQVPPVALTQLGDAAPFTDESLRAPGVKLVNYWASWCAACRAEHPNLETLAEEGVPIYGINYKDDPEKALAFLDELGDPYVALGADERGRTALDWELYGVPETYVVNGEGRIVLRFSGPITETILESQIRPAIASASE